MASALTYQMWNFNRETQSRAVIPLHHYTPSYMLSYSPVRAARHISLFLTSAKEEQRACRLIRADVRRIERRRASWLEAKQLLIGIEARRRRDGTTYIVSSIRVIIDAPKECSRSIFPNIAADELSTARMFLNEIRNVVYKTRNKYERSLFLAFDQSDGGMGME